MDTRPTELLENVLARPKAALSGQHSTLGCYAPMVACGFRMDDNEGPTMRPTSEDNGALSGPRNSRTCAIPPFG